MQNPKIIQLQKSFFYGSALWQPQKPACQLIDVIL